MKIFSNKFVGEQQRKIFLVVSHIMNTTNGNFIVDFK
jgi:hypothetical protein